VVPLDTLDILVPLAQLEKPEILAQLELLEPQDKQELLGQRVWEGQRDILVKQDKPATQVVQVQLE
jgi:hypothetical protein